MEKVACRTPALDRDGVTNIPVWKFEAVRGAILDALAEGPMLYKDLNTAVGARLDAATLGSGQYWKGCPKVENASDRVNDLRLPRYGI